MSLRFDLTSFTRAIEARDAVAWLEFYADDAEWLEYKHTYPPRSPRVIRGRSEISAFLERIAAGGVTLRVEDEIAGADRAAFRMWVTLPDGRRIIEHVIVHLRDGKITRQVDVESWDPED